MTTKDFTSPEGLQELTDTLYNEDVVKTYEDEIKDYLVSEVNPVPVGKVSLDEEDEKSFEIIF